MIQLIGSEPDFMLLAGNNLRNQLGYEFFKEE